jgi:DNA-3-methyladenine glycosylase
VYFTYGMHFCVNLVCLAEGTASAVLLRAGRVIGGIPLAAARRSAATGAERDLARGPARLCQALGIDRGQDGADVCDPASPLRIRSTSAPVVGGAEVGGADAGTPVNRHPLAARPASAAISRGPRVGVSSAADRAWRFWLTGDPTVSAYRPHVRRARAKPVSPPAAEGGTMPR